MLRGGFGTALVTYKIIVVRAPWRRRRQLAKRQSCLGICPLALAGSSPLCRRDRQRWACNKTALSLSCFFTSDHVLLRLLAVTAAASAGFAVAALKAAWEVTAATPPLLL
jgi:hypothetical protein